VPSYLYFNAIKNAHLSALKQKEQFRVDVQSQAFKDEFKNIASDLIVLTSHRELWDAINGVKTLNLDALEYEFRMFSRTKDIYDQVRLLDLQGNEKKSELILINMAQRLWIKSHYRTRRNDIIF
jgi:hypothetical protein